MDKESTPYRTLCSEFYELDKPEAPAYALQFYMHYAEEAKGPILEPMCGTGRFLIPLVEKGYSVTGFDYSPYMLSLCRRKCQVKGLSPLLFEATFESYSAKGNYQLIYIPSSSFCLLINENQVANALKFISDRLLKGGKFVFEVMTLQSLSGSEGMWKGRWVEKADHSQIVLNTLSRFDTLTGIESVLCRYELWEKNVIIRTEVEDLRLKLYNPGDIERLLNKYELKILGKWQAEPHARVPAGENTSVIVYECQK